MAAAIGGLPVHHHLAHRFETLRHSRQRGIAKPAQKGLETGQVTRRAVVTDPECTDQPVAALNGDRHPPVGVVGVEAINTPGMSPIRGSPRYLRVA